jgi:isopenicillin N synthase-like dioxygenase
MEVGICNVKSYHFEQDLLRSVRNTGFAVLTQHGIDEKLIKAAQFEWKKFFTQEQTRKNLFVNGNNVNMGYRGMGTETAVGSTVADLKEFYHWKPGEIIPEELQGVNETLYNQLSELGLLVLNVLQRYAHANYVEAAKGSPNTLFRTLYYPALKSLDTKDGAVRSAAHEDINYITLLVAASAPGLQVKDVAGNWHDVPHEKNSITLNIGDMLQLQSMGVFKSTTHRVVNPPDDTSDRISMPLFIHPHPETLLAENYTAGQFLKERIDQIYGKK